MITEFNAACSDEAPFNPNILDGRRTNGLAIDKTNWANRLESLRSMPTRSRAGITFTFGGLKITTEAEVEDQYGGTIPGLYAAGEIVGGLFYGNYASGTGTDVGGNLRAPCRTQCGDRGPAAFFAPSRAAEV